MSHFSQRLRVSGVALTALVLASGMAFTQSQQQGNSKQQGNQDNRTTLKPDAPGLAHNHRLILKDGSYQIVRQYQVAGDRVRYLSLERGGDWEELPYDLVDWNATRKWEQSHTGPYESSEGASPAMKEAEEIDKEEAAATAAMRQRPNS